MEDIEDLVLGEEDAPLSRLERSDIQPSHAAQQKRRRRQEQQEVVELLPEIPIPELKNEESEIGVDKPVVPGVANVFVKTWGCAHNNSDGEYMAGLLSEYGYEVSTEDSEAKDADVWVLNSCTVKGPAESHFVNTIKEAHAQGKKVVIAGCVPQAWGSSKSGKSAASAAEASDLSVIGVQQIDRVVEVVEETLKGNTVRLMGTKTSKIISNNQNSADTSDINSNTEGNSEGGSRGTKIKLGGAKLDLPKIRRNPLVEIVPISTGCLNQCTYCKTKHARGHLGSYPIEEIVNRIKQVVSEGVLEIWLTSEDTGAYGRDIGTDITKLLWEILAVLPEPVMLRMGMTNPPYIKEHIKEMARIYRHPRIYSYLHMPIQSASNNVLEAMKREYTRQDFEEIVDCLKSDLPDLNVATDLIVGFPGETHEDYRQTWDLVQKYQFSVLFINQFYPRPGTPAAKMKRVNTNEVKDRTRELSAWFKAYMPYASRIGEKHKILITELAPDGIHVAGRTKSYEMTLVKSDLPIEQFMGRVVEIEIVETGKFYLMGVPTPESLEQLDMQPLPRESVLRKEKKVKRKVSPLTAINAASVKPNTTNQNQNMKSNVAKERLDYHEGDDGEDYEEEDLNVESDCSDGCEESSCGTGGCGDCGGSDKAKTSGNAASSGNNNAATASEKGTSVIGPSSPLTQKSKRPKPAISEEQIAVAFILVVVAVLLLSYPWLKQVLG